MTDNQVRRQRRLPVHCTECDKVHDWPRLKFKQGDRVRIIDPGYHHSEHVGEVVSIHSLNDFGSMPCDEPEYFTSLGGGAICEHRLRLAEEPQ